MDKIIKNTNIAKKEKIVNLIRIILIVALAVIIFYPPYLQGLFFEKNILPAQIFTFIIFIIFLIYKWLKNDIEFFKSPIEYICLSFVVVYFISIFAAVHTRSSIIEWLKYCMYFAVFYMMSDLADNQKTKLLFLCAILISAVGVSIIGLDAALGGNIVEILNKCFSILGVQGDLFFGLFVDNRIHSTLQYPNALASYLMAIFFVNIGLLLIYNKWWQKVILCSSSYILFTTFMLTQSRGAQLLFPVAVIILFVTTPKDKKINAVTHVLMLVIPPGVISLFLTPYLSSKNISHEAFFLLFIGLLLEILFSFFVRFLGNILQKVSWKVYITIFLISVIVIGIGANYVINSSVPVELSLLDSQENKTVYISKDVKLKPNKTYILRFEAEGKMKDAEKPYVFSVRLFNKTINNILFYGSEQLVRQDFSITNGFETFDLLFGTREDTKLVNVTFSIVYSGTSVIIKNASIVDDETGKTVKRIILKNKYNLDNIISRFQNIWLQQSLVSRAIFYRDGFNIFRERWFLGAGGGAWNYLYKQYQSYNYASSQAHNYPLQLGIEAGILGIIVLTALVIVLVIGFTKYYKEGKSNLISSSIITAIAALFMHSVIDFDFAECSMLLLFWSLISLFNRELIDSLIIDDVKLLKVKLNLNRNKYTTSKKGKSGIFIGIIVSVIALYFSVSFSIASSFAKQSYESLQNDDIETAINKMEKAIKLDKYNEKYVLGYNPIPSRPNIKEGFTDLLFMKNEKFKKAQENDVDILESDLHSFQKQLSKAALYIKDIEKKAKNNLSLTSDLASYYFKIGEIDKGINYLNLAISYCPYEPSLWHSKVDVFYKLMREYFNNEDFEKAKEYLIKGLSVIDDAKKVNKTNMNPFEFNEITVKLLQTMKFMYDHWGTDAIYDVNEVIHYSMFNLDINLDGFPDQWRINDAELISVSIDEETLAIQARGEAFLYTQYPISLKKGRTYRVEVKMNGDVEFLHLYVYGITTKSIPFSKEGDKFIAEITIENEPNDIGNQFRIYLKSNCEIENILVKEMK